MKQEDSYRHWIEARSHIDVSPDFADRVMSQVKLKPSRGSQRAFRWPRLVDHISAWPWAKAAAIAVASILGIGRMLLALHLLLSV